MTFPEEDIDTLTGRTLRRREGHGAVLRPQIGHGLPDAGEAYRELTDSGRRGGGRPRSCAAASESLRADARAGRLDSGAVEIVLSSVARRSRRLSGPAGLTRRETQVLALIATGAATKQVASMLGIAPKTAATHIERIYAKTAVTNRAAATRFAIQHGLVEPVP